MTRERTSAGRQPRRSEVTRRPVLPKTEKGRRTREVLMAGVARALNQHGYQALRIDDIALAADVPVGLFYRYFRGKSDATLEVLRRMVEEYRAAIPPPGPATPFWDREIALHRTYVSLFKEHSGLLGCYFSYDFGGAAFESLFIEETRRFVREHSIAVQLALPGRKLTEAAIRPVALALVSMSDNFTYRFFTGRDEFPADESIDVAWLLAALRYRGFLLQDPPPPQAIDLSFLRGPVDTSDPQQIRGIGPEPTQPLTLLGENKRSDAQVTLKQIRASTLALLDRLGYDDLRIADIEMESGLTRGVVYYHFKDKRDLVVSVLVEWVDSIHRAMIAAADVADARGGAFFHLHQLAQALVTGFITAPGVMRTLYHLEEDDRELAGYYRARRRQWASLIGAPLRRYIAVDKKHDGLIDLLGYAFLGMSDRLLYDLYVARYPDAADLAQPARVSTLLASLWHRMAFLANPPRSALEAFPVLQQLVPETSAVIKRMRTSRAGSKTEPTRRIRSQRRGT